jgi:hypothetical protein
MTRIAFLSPLKSSTWKFSTISAKQTQSWAIRGHSTIGFFQTVARTSNKNVCCWSEWLRERLIGKHTLPKRSSPSLCIWRDTKGYSSLRSQSIPLVEKIALGESRKSAKVKRKVRCARSRHKADNKVIPTWVSDAQYTQSASLAEYGRVGVAHGVWHSRRPRTCF